MTSSVFDRDTAVARRDDGAFDAELSPRWTVAHTLNGGYLMVVAARALGATLGSPDPLSLTAHYASPVAPGPAVVATEVLRDGRLVSSGQAAVVQGGQRRVLVVGAFGGLDPPGSSTGRGQARAGTGLLVPGDGPPALPPPEDCLPARPRASDGSPVPLVEQFDLRLHPGTAGWARDAPTGRAEVGGWIRLADGRDPDTWLLPLVADALPPTVFDVGYSGWVPTVELTVHVRARPAPGWLRCWVRSRLATGGFVEEDAEVWDADGRLVAMSRQLARLPGTRRA